MSYKKQEDDYGSTASEWGRCHASGCNLAATIKTGGYATCSHHYGVFDHQTQEWISDRVKSDRIRGIYLQISNCSYSKWVQHWLPKLVNAKNPELRPAEIGNGQHETQSMYMHRLYKMMDMHIAGKIELEI